MFPLSQRDRKEKRKKEIEISIELESDSSCFELCFKRVCPNNFAPCFGSHREPNLAPIPLLTILDFNIARRYRLRFIGGYVRWVCRVHTTPLCTPIDSFNLPFQQLPCDPWKRRGAARKEGVLSKCHVRHSRLLPLLTRLENSLTLTREMHGMHAYT